MRVPVDLALTAFDSSDATSVRRWRNDMRVSRWCRQKDVISDVDQERWYARQSEDPSIQMYSVRLKTGAADELVGVAGLTSIDWFNRRAEFSLYVDPARQRQGLGRAALQLLLAHAFVNLGLEQVWGEVLDGNPAMKLFESLGFVTDGKRRGWYYKAGRAWDAHLISITREEYHGRSTRPLAPDGGGQSGRDAGVTQAADRPAKRASRGRPRGRGIAAVVEGHEPNGRAEDHAGSRDERRAGSAQGARGAGEDAEPGA